MGATGVRADLVAKFKREIADKTYKVKSEEIAGKIAQKLREEESAVIDGLTRKNRWTA
ncbi:MAG: flagellar biosynthesis anti-sigma factor FlgM [Nitrospinae bacterium]|nr:flagellar biosynthesis anti-sigma factor FlgM [Nitrospinota bacterium]